MSECGGCILNEICDEICIGYNLSARCDNCKVTDYCRGVCDNLPQKEKHVLAERFFAKLLELEEQNG